MRFQGKRVSTDWETVLTAAAKDGVRFVLNSGQRTMSEQAALVRQKGVWSMSNQTGAARPSPDAPHIRVGRQAHALDVSTLDGGHRRLAHWLTMNGLRVRFPIVREPWHTEVEESQLRALAARARRPPLTPVELRLVRAYDHGTRAQRRRLRPQLVAARKRVWRAAQGPGGWDAQHRTERYASLMARTR